LFMSFLVLWNHFEKFLYGNNVTLKVISYIHSSNVLPVKLVCFSG
jgi:hypothetical protein